MNKHLQFHPKHLKTTAYANTCSWMLEVSIAEIREYPNSHLLMEKYNVEYSYNEIVFINKNQILTNDYDVKLPERYYL